MLTSTYLIFTLSLASIMQASPTEMDHQQEQFSAFAEHLGEFNPTETFEFDLEATEQETFIFWPPPETKFIRGMFYVTSQNNNGLFVGIQHDNEMKKTFWDKKIGVFNVPYTVGDIKLILKSELKRLTIYLSYELASPSQKKTAPQTQQKETIRTNIKQQGDNQTQEVGLSEPRVLSELLIRYSKIKSSLQGQEELVKSIISGSRREMLKLEEQMQSKSWRVAVETIVLMFSGLASILLLKREMSQGYEFIV